MARKERPLPAILRNEACGIALIWKIQEAVDRSFGEDITDGKIRYLTLGMQVDESATLTLLTGYMHIVDLISRSDYFPVASFS
jgi:hypothetical protein